MVSKIIKELVFYAKTHLFLEELDSIYAGNMLLGYFHVDAPYEGEIDEESIARLDTPDTLVEALQNELNAQGISVGEAERMAIFALGLLTPHPSLVQGAFEEFEHTSPKEATEFLYNLSVANFYVRKKMIDKNIHFDAHFREGSDLEISINLSKPEKKNSDIAKLLVNKSVSYPACLLCRENLGYYGRDGHPARSNIRFVELELEGRTWYLQFSPYGYFDRHCILFEKEHEQMEVSPRIFATLLSFVERFPHYFMGSNADLPIVGGSILNHEHFQGGAHLLPVMKAPLKEIVPCSDKRVEVGVLDFYDTALRLASEDKDALLAVASKILTAWRQYDDPENNILHATGDTLHNTITGIARKEGGRFLLYMILRNNRCSEDLPDGIFHVNPCRQHIKSEGIGLIEASGLFILPARLKRQGEEVVDVVANNLSDEKALEKYPDIGPFLGMAKKMKQENQSLQDYLAEVCQNILIDVAVFKPDAKGRAGLATFLEACKL